jgi:hypothetical protein
MFPGREIFVVFGKLGKMLVTDVEETRALSHRPGPLDALTHRQLFVDRDHCPAEAPFQLL